MVKFFPPHLTAACDSEADSGKSSNDVFMGPKTLARSYGLFLDGLNQARILVSLARHIDPFRDRPHAQKAVWRSSELRGEVFEESANSRLKIFGSGATFVHLILCNIAVAVANPRAIEW